MPLKVRVNRRKKGTGDFERAAGGICTAGKRRGKIIARLIARLLEVSYDSPHHLPGGTRLGSG